MADLQSVLGYQQLTRTVQTIRFPNFWFANQVTDEPIEGNIAQWDIEKPAIEIDTDFTTNSGEAQPVRMGTYGTRSQKMPVTFKFSSLDPGILAQLRQVGGTRRAVAGREYIVREQASIQRRFGAYLDEYLVAMALTGSLSIKINGQAVVIDYGIPASHKPTASVSWATTSTNVLDDLTEWKRIIRKDTGMEPKWAVCNQGVMNYLIRNTYIQNLIGQTAVGIQIAETGNLSRFHGLNWIVLDHHYAQEGATERFDTPFIGNDKLFILPDFSPEWIRMQRGTVVVPNSDRSDVMDLQGPVMWSRVQDSPTGVTLYYKNARLPVMPIPGAVIYADVTP
jgi:hypothetical protein